MMQVWCPLTGHRSPRAETVDQLVAERPTAGTSLHEQSVGQLLLDQCSRGSVRTEPEPNRENIILDLSQHGSRRS